MKKNKKLTAEMRALEKQRKAEQYRERELAKTEASEVEEVVVNVEQPKVSNTLKREKRKQLKEKRKQRKEKIKEEKRKLKAQPTEPTPIEPTEPTVPIDVKPVVPETPEPPTPPSTPVKPPKPTPPSTPVKPPKPIATAWDGKALLDLMQKVENGIKELKTDLENDDITNYKGSNNRYANAANEVYDELGNAENRLKRAKDTINRFLDFKIPLNKDTVGEEYIREIDENYTVLSEWEEKLHYATYNVEYDDNVRTKEGTDLDEMEQMSLDLQKLTSAIVAIGVAISRGARSKGRTI